MRTFDFAVRVQVKSVALGGRRIVGSFVRGKGVDDPWFRSARRSNIR